MPPPREYRSITKEALLHKYQTENWEQKLSQYSLTQWRCGNFKIGFEWHDNDGDLICRLFKYNNPLGINIVVRQLRDGDVFYDIDLPPDTVLLHPIQA